MNIYKRKQQWKLLLFLGAVVIAISSLWYTNRLVKMLAHEEEKKIALWAKAEKTLFSASEEVSGDFSFPLDVISSNTTIPLILTNAKGAVLNFRNLDSLRALSDSTYLKQELISMRAAHLPIEISYPIDPSGQIFEKNYIYYKDSTILTRLRYYPYFQLSVIAGFLGVCYLAFSTSRRAEQNQVWVGMAKETAHQLGTPISSLMAWTEYLKAANLAPEIIPELEKDILRLHTITDRFSKIGSAPTLKVENLKEVLESSVEYMQKRSSSKVNYKLTPPSQTIWVAVNLNLFEWVIENLCKNAIDAMDGVGSISISVKQKAKNAIIEIKDTGKGIPKSKFKTIFNPGYTTKSRGWGLGLTLVKRIMHEYHPGQVFVKDSELGKGTTFVIVLPLAHI